MLKRTWVSLAIGVALGATTCSLAWASGENQAAAANKGGKNQYATPDPSESSSRAASKPASPATSTPNPAKPAADADRDKFDYRIGVEDELQISVWREPELSLPVVVRPDGMITLPLLSDVSVVGLKTEELQALLTEKLKAFVNDPQVTVTVRTIRSRKVYLAGQVARPGAYSLNGQKTVIELIVESGGLALFAKKGSIYVLRSHGGQQVRIPLDYNKVLAGKMKDVELLPGDMVVVP